MVHISQNLVNIIHLLAFSGDWRTLVMEQYRGSVTPICSTLSFLVYLYSLALWRYVVAAVLRGYVMECTRHILVYIYHMICYQLYQFRAFIEFNSDQGAIQK